MTPEGSPDSRKERDMHEFLEGCGMELLPRVEGTGSKCVFGGDSWVLVSCVFTWLLVSSGFLLTHESVSTCMFVQKIICFMEMVKGLRLESSTVSPPLWDLGANLLSDVCSHLFVFCFFLLN